MNHDDVRRDLLRAWTEQLYKEHENVRLYFGVRIGTPVICIEELTSSWGQWQATTRKLTISRRLIEQYSWDIVIEILKHEMAHQIADELLGGGGGLPHGAAFQRACDMLRVAEWARSASGALPESIPNWRDRSLSVEEEKLLKRVEKLLALAGSNNEHEAALAMQRVRQLYAQYNLESLRDKRQATYVYCIINQKLKRISSEESMIFSVLTRHFFVRAIYLDQFDAQDACSYKAVELLGTHENVLMAEYVYHFLRNQLRSLWTDYQRRTRKPANARRSYMLGVLSGFSDKLTAAAATRPTESGETTLSASAERALIRQGDQELAEFVGQRYPRLSNRRSGGLRGDKSSFDAGVSAGTNLNLHRGVTERSGSKGLLLRG